MPKKQKKMTSSQTVEVKVPLTSTAVMAILLAGLLSLMVWRVLSKKNFGQLG